MKILFLLGWTLNISAYYTAKADMKAKPNLVDKLNSSPVKGIEDLLPFSKPKFDCDKLHGQYKGEIQIINGFQAFALNHLLDPLQQGSLLKDFAKQCPIYPGTLWCGPNDLARQDNDLGYHKKTDSCCRDHDHCSDFIRAGEAKYSLKNTHDISILTCDCDNALRNCLKKVNTPDSNMVGYIYFSLLQTQCFKYEYPVTHCIQKKLGPIREYCAKYGLAYNLPKMYQFFDEELWDVTDFNPLL